PLTLAARRDTMTFFTPFFRGLKRRAAWAGGSGSLVSSFERGRGGQFVAIVQVKDLIEAGVHFGHRASRWNPKMRPYIYGKRNLSHIIDLRETVRGLLRAHRFLAQLASKGSLVLFVGTKRQAKDIVEREAGRCGMPFVNERWLGGSLTNYRTIRDRLNRLQELDQLWLSAG